MANVPVKHRLYRKALRILFREIHKLDLKSRNGELESQDRKDLVMMIKPLEADIKEETVKPKKIREQEDLIRQAQEVLDNLNVKKDS